MRANAVTALQRLASDWPATWLGATCFLWGVFLILPLDTFGTTHAWDAVREVGLEEWQMGALVALVGLWKMISVVSGRYSWRRVAAMSSALTWGCIGTILIRANAAGTGTVIYPMLVVATGLDFIWLRFGPSFRGDR